MTTRRLPLSALRAYAAVYESGGVRPAARKLGVAHSSVSRHLAELQRWLNVELFEKPRSARGNLVFTVQGHALGRVAVEGLSGLATAVEGIRELRRANSVVITTTASLAVRWLIPRLADLQKTHGWVELSVVTEQSVKPLLEQGADLALRMGGGPWPDGTCEPLMDDELYPVATRRYWNSLRERSPARALAKARLLHDRDPSSSWERWVAEHPAGIDLRVGPRFTSSDLVLRAAAEGLGVALARHQLVAREIESGVLIRPCGAARVQVSPAYWLLLAPGREPRPAVDAVAQWIRSQAGKSR